MTPVDALLEHAAHATRAAWAAAVPEALLDRWWALGARAHVYAVVEVLDRERAGRLLARYAAIEPDPAHAPRLALHAIAAVAHTQHLPAVLATIPIDDAGVREVARAATRYTVHEREMRQLLEPDASPDLDALEAEPVLLAKAATRVAPELAVATFERALSKWIDEAVDSVAIVARAIDAWHVLSAPYLPAAARIAGLCGEHAAIDVVLARATNAGDRALVIANAIVATGRTTDAWSAELRACGEWLAQLHDEGVITDNDRATCDAALALCDGDSAFAQWTDRVLAAAWATAEARAGEIGAPLERATTEPERATLRETIAAARAKWRTVRHRVLRQLRLAGARGDRELVREAVDALEATYGPLHVHEEYGIAAVLAYYPGRAREVAQRLDDHARPDERSHVAAGLAADDAIELARAHAARVLAAPAGTLAHDTIARVAGIVLGERGDARARLAAFVAQALANVPRSAEWLTGPAVVDRPPPRPVARARSPELEASLVERDDPAAALVYADFLQAQGDPRGELIALQHAGKDAEANAWIRRHREHFLGGLDAPVTWRLGFIEAARVGFDHEQPGAPLDVTLAALLAHPSGALLRELVVPINHTAAGSSDFAPAIATLAQHGAPALRRLRLGHFAHVGARSPSDGWRYHGRPFEISWTRFASLADVWVRLPRLEALTLQGCFPAPIFDGIVAPNLRELTVISGGLAAGNTRAIAAADLPMLETLELWFGSEDYGFSGDVADLAPLLAGTRVPRLRRLRLMNASFADDLVPALAASRLLPRLAELSLALGTLCDAEQLAHHAGAFAHLELLDVEDNCLGDDEIELVTGAVRNVRIGSQKAPDDERYVSVAE